MNSSVRRSQLTFPYRGDRLSSTLAWIQAHFQTPLVRNGYSLVASTGMMLLVSGLLVDQRDEIVVALADFSLYSRRERERDGWLAMKFARAESCEGV